MPAYEPTELHNQRTPPRLILDDDDSDIEDKRITDSGSMSNLDDDTLSDILNSDDERVIRPSHSSPPYSPGITNPAFIENEEATENSSPVFHRKPGGNSKSPTPAERNAKLSVNAINVNEQRESSIASSDLSLDASEDTVFLPAKDKKQEKQKKVKNFLSPSNGVKNSKRSSIIPVGEDEGIRKGSAREVKSTNKSKMEQNLNENSGKPPPAFLNNERRLVTPKDTYSKGKKATMASTLGGSRHSPRAEEIGISDAESSGKEKMKGSRLSATPTAKKKNSVSVAAITGVKEDSEESVTKIRVKPTTPLNERRKSTAEPARFGESRPEVARATMDEPVTEKVTEDKNTAATEKKKKKKKKKEKAEKETKTKVIDSDDSSKEQKANSILDLKDGLTVAIGTSEEQSDRCVASQNNETKTKKKKKRKEKERKKRKSENPEPSSDEESQCKSQDFSSDITAVTTTSQRTPAIQDETKSKKKMKKEVTKERRKTEIPEERPATERKNGSFVRSTNNFKGDSLNTVGPERRRTKSICIEDMESRSPPIDEETRRKTDIPETSEDWKKQSSSSQINTRSQPNSISPIPTGYKSPRLVIKPSYHHY